MAFALSSQAYRDKLNEPDPEHPARVVERSEVFMPDLYHPTEDSNTSTWGVVDLEGGSADVDATLRKPSAKHFRLRELLLPSVEIQAKLIDLFL